MDAFIKETVTTTEAYKMLGIGRTKLFLMMKSGEIPFIKISEKRVLIRISDIKNFLKMGQSIDKEITRLVVSIKEAAVMLSISRSSLYTLLSEKPQDLPIVKIGRRSLLRVADLENFVNKGRNEQQCN